MFRRVARHEEVALVYEELVPAARYHHVHTVELSGELEVFVHVL